MIIDYYTQLSSEQAITATAVSTNVLDMDQAAEYGNGDPVRIRVQVQTAFVQNSDSDLQVVVQSSVDNSTYTDAAMSPVYDQASIAAGTVLLDIRLPRRKAGASAPRYYRINYVNSATDWTSGKVDAFMVVDSEQLEYYA